MPQSKRTQTKLTSTVGVNVFQVFLGMGESASVFWKMASPFPTMPGCVIPPVIPGPRLFPTTQAPQQGLLPFHRIAKFYFISTSQSTPFHFAIRLLNAAVHSLSSAANRSRRFASVREGGASLR
jgi:hypothetical protein